MTETEFNRKMEIETQMAEDKEREAQRVSRLADNPVAKTSKLPISAVKRVATQGAVKRPLTPRMRRPF